MWSRSILPGSAFSSQPTRAAWIEIYIMPGTPFCNQSRSPLGLRGLKSFLISLRCYPRLCRSPLGLRGLKFIRFKIVIPAVLSQPTRAAWIEIARSVTGDWSVLCRSPLGLRGLKWQFLRVQADWRDVAAHSGCVD